MSRSETPLVTVDRAAMHYFSEVGLDGERAASFYSSLPLESKPPLGDCRIHYSALAYSSPGGSWIYGAEFPANRWSTKVYDPQVPRANIMVFLGSYLLDGSDIDLGEVTGHELTHYAQGHESMLVTMQRGSAMLLKTSTDRLPVYRSKPSIADRLFERYVEETADENEAKLHASLMKGAVHAPKLGNKHGVVIRGLSPLLGRWSNRRVDVLHQAISLGKAPNSGYPFARTSL